ncbi:MAG: hypothetical protein LBQ79_12410, partial [Deltaproteobacteria bacterium]|nr:hypothetical protein [Deltaproteobacteria bacterium]
MTDTVRRPPGQKPAAAKEPPAAAPRKRLNDYRKAETPFGTVLYRRPDTDASPPRRTGRPGHAVGPFRGPGGNGSPGHCGPQDGALAAALDREIPLAVERLLEAEKVLAESASGVLDLAEALQRETAGLTSFAPLAARADLTVRSRLAEFASAVEGIATGLFEKSSFHDLCGQRLAKVREAVGVLGEILQEVKAAWDAPRPAPRIPVRRPGPPPRSGGPGRTGRPPRPGWTGKSEGPPRPRKAENGEGVDSGDTPRRKPYGAADGDNAPKRKPFGAADGDNAP